MTFSFYKAARFREGNNREKRGKSKFSVSRCEFASQRKRLKVQSWMKTSSYSQNLSTIQKTRKRMKMKFRFLVESSHGSCAESVHVKFIMKISTWIFPLSAEGKFQVFLSAREKRNEKRTSTRLFVKFSFYFLLVKILFHLQLTFIKHISRKLAQLVAVFFYFFQNINDFVPLRDLIVIV